MTPGLPSTTSAAPFLALTPEKPVSTGPNDRSTHSLLAGRP